MSVQIVDRLSTIAPAQWDALIPTGEPFLRHAFLTSLEDSGSLGPRSGWQAEHAVLYKAEVLIAALPLIKPLPALSTAWLVIGGAAYTVGVVFYAVDSSVRYAHAVWHACVAAGTTCHVFAVLSVMAHKAV